MTRQSIFKKLVATLCVVALPIIIHAQTTGSVEGIVVDTETSGPVAGANIFIPELNKGAATDAEGAFSITSIPSGTYEIEFSFLGYRTKKQSITISEGEQLELTVQLSPSEMKMKGITVTSLRPDLKIDAEMEQSQIRKANPRDSGELLRSVNAVDAVRRGAVGLDPVVRGLRETEVGTYLDGTRIFPAGPARMDSPLSHLDPSMVEHIEVVKGPYALNWGAGNMSAIRVETKSLNNLNTTFSGEISSGYDSNFNTFEVAASLYGQSGKVGYMVSGAWRTGDNYRSGNGTTIPADYLSREVRGKASYTTSSNSRVTVSLGYQNQEDIDYPGRLLDADYFNTYNASAGWEWNSDNQLIQNMNAKIYLNNVTHGMDNDNKPTAEPDPDRMPPFALDVDVETKNHVYGGKFATTLSTADHWEWEIGTDIYSSYREAVRTIARRDNGQQLFLDLMWPEAMITEWGIYNRLNYSFSDRLSATASVRLDLVSADADTISQFYEQNVSTDLDSREANIGTSGTLNYQLSDFWSVGLGLGSVVRTADATERYSDRIPASKAQMSAEFVGNPDLNPERSTQADLWLEGSYQNINLALNGFVRQMNNYITLEATDLPKRLPLSPETVYQYINGSARFTGFDVSARYRITEPLIINSSISYLWGEDTELDEPALGVSPLSVTVGLRYELSSHPLFLESTAEFVSEQDRVATARDETSTDEYIVVDFLGGWSITNSISLQLGVKNLFDYLYVNHLNAKNPYTISRVAEPGRVFFGDVSIKF